MNTLPQRGVLRVVPPAALDAAIKAQDEARAAAEAAAQTPEMSNLAGFIRTQFEIMRTHRNNAQSGWSERLLSALRAFNGQYDALKLAEIRKFGGSEVYARVIAMKCRGASSLLRDVYLAPDRPWGIQAGPDPEVPPEIMQSIQQLVQSEAGTLQVNGRPPDVASLRDRTLQLMAAAREAAKKKTVLQAKVAEDKVDELLIDGGFYKALSEFLTDLPLFPFACIKGPVVRIVPTVAWQNGQATVQQIPRLFWNRISPFDIW